jgi:p-aminobenzoyl-glutamate transporter AbgT
VSQVSPERIFVAWFLVGIPLGPGAPVRTD